MRSRPGFALLTAVMALVMVSVIAAVAVLPLAEVSVHQQRVDDTYGYLVRLTDTEKRGVPKFVEMHGQPPAEMVHLSSPLPGGAVGACGTSYRTPGDWEPQADRLFGSTGVPTPIGLIDNALVRTGAEVMVAITDVHLADAQRLDTTVDDPAGSADGRVRWAAPDAQDLVTLYWVTPFTC